MLRRSVVAICIVSSPVGPWLRTAGALSRVSIRRPPPGQARALRGALLAKGNRNEECRRGGLRHGCRVSEGMRVLTGVCGYRLVAMPGSKPKKNQRMFRSLCAYILCSNSSSFSHRRKGFRLVEHVEQNRSNGRWPGPESKVANVRRRPAPASDLGLTETGGLTSSRGCEPSFRDDVVHL